MALTDILLPTASADLVAVLGDNFNQVFELARPMKSIISRTSRAMEHPVEDGTVITDHRIIDPVEIEISVFVADDVRSVFSQIEQLFLAGAILTVQGRTSSYPSMILTQMPYEETPDIYDGIIILLRFKEVKFVEAQFGKLPPRKVENQANSDTKKRGTINAIETDEGRTERGSILYRSFIEGQQ